MRHIHDDLRLTDGIGIDPPRNLLSIEQDSIDLIQPCCELHLDVCEAEQGTGKFVSIYAPLAEEGEGEVRCLEAGTVPFGGKSWPDHYLTIDAVGSDTEKAFCE